MSVFNMRNLTLFKKIFPFHENHESYEYRQLHSIGKVQCRFDFKAGGICSIRCTLKNNIPHVFVESLCFFKPI